MKTGIPWYRSRGALAVAAAGAGLLLTLACAGASAPQPERYRLAHSGDHWDVVRGDRVVEDLAGRYPDFFAVLTAGGTGELDLRELRDDLERRPVDRHNYDALNVLAIAYFEVNFRAEERRGELVYLTHSFQAARILAVPWRAYSEIDDGPLRDAILDFFEDAASGEKLATARTAGRLTKIVASLEAKETDLPRRDRILGLVARLEDLELLAAGEEELP
jgi:hypothetical protein